MDKGDVFDWIIVLALLILGPPLIALFLAWLMWSFKWAFQLFL